MAIQQIADRSQRSILRTIGKLRKGDVKPERGPGRDLDTVFRFTADDPAVMAAFMNAYHTDRVESVRAYLPFAHVRDNWDYWIEGWARAGQRNRLVYRCDGVVWVKWLVADGRSYSHERKTCPYCSGEQPAKPGDHKPVGRLALILPELLSRGCVGQVTLETHALTDLYAIEKDLYNIQTQRTDGREDLRGIEVIIHRVLRDIPTKEHGVRTLGVVTVEPVAEWIEAQVAQARAAALAIGVPTGKIPVLGGVNVDPETGELLDDETEAPWDEGTEQGNGAAAKPAAAKPAAAKSPAPAPAPAAPAAGKSQAPKEWYETQEGKARVTSLTKGLEISSAEELATASGVAKLRDFPGTLDDLCDALRDYAAGRERGNAGLPADWNGKDENRATIVEFAVAAAGARQIAAPGYRHVLQALGVERLADFMGTFLQAQTKIIDLLDEPETGEPEPGPPPEGIDGIPGVESIAF